MSGFLATIGSNKSQGSPMYPMVVEKRDSKEDIEMKALGRSR